MTDAQEIFTTIHGSRLYGFATGSSDRDVFTVTTSTSPKARQKIDGMDDTFTVGLTRFLDLATSGSHQSVEALFSPYKVWADTPAVHQYRPMIESIRVGGVAEKFERTIRKFAYEDFKRRRHACRLTLALDSLRIMGAMRPALTPWQVAWCNRTAAFEGDTLVTALGLTPRSKEATE